MEEENLYSYYHRYKESKTARDIRIVSEVEKIWILYDLDNNGELDFDEISRYLDEVAYPHLSLTQRDLKTIFESIDADNSGSINKQEMVRFVDNLLKLLEKIFLQKAL